MPPVCTSHSEPAPIRFASGERIGACLYLRTDWPKYHNPRTAGISVDSQRSGKDEANGALIGIVSPIESHGDHFNRLVDQLGNWHLNLARHITGARGLLANPGAIIVDANLEVADA